MNEPDQTLRYLESAARPRPVERPLYCPECGADRGVTGATPTYRCACGFTFASLAELVTDKPITWSDICMQCGSTCCYCPTDWSDDE